MKGKSFSHFMQAVGLQSCISTLIQGVEVDSRKVEKDFVFFALKGAKVDGHDYLEDVAKKGAIAAFVSKEYKGEVQGLPLFPVDDVLDTLQRAAKSRIKESRAKIVAITGSVGKTTTKEYVATLLSAKFSVMRTPGNANSQIGLSLSLVNAEDLDKDFLVLEMGMTEEHGIEKLVTIAPPDYALITKVAPAHIGNFFDGLEGIARAKAEIMNSPNTVCTLINAGAKAFSAIQKQTSCAKLFFSLHKEDLSEYSLQKEKGKYFLQKGKEKSPLFALPFAESHLQENFLAAASLAQIVGLSWEEIISQIPLLSSCKNRFEKIERNQILYINDTYNANTESVKAALTNLPKPKKGSKVIAVLGDMSADLGYFSKEGHEEIGRVASLCVDLLICYGKESKATAQVFSLSGKESWHFLDLGSLRKKMGKIAKAGDVVLVKGSNAMQMWQIFDDIV